jgi:hypothetical protein
MPESKFQVGTRSLPGGLDVSGDFKRTTSVSAGMLEEPEEEKEEGMLFFEDGWMDGWMDGGLLVYRW